MNVEEYNSTVGLNCAIPGKGRKLIKFAYDKLENGKYRCYVESAHNLGVYKNYSTRTLTAEQIAPLLDYDNIRTFENFARFWGIRPSHLVGTDTY